MLASPVRISSDYNRGLSATARCAHWLSTLTAPIHAPPRRLCASYWAWAGRPARAWWARLLTIGLLLALLVLPFDAAISHWLRHAKVGGDVKLTLRTIGQFGDLITSLLMGWAIYLVAPEKRRHLADWVMAALLGAIMGNALKMTLGRLRPELDHPYTFIGPLKAFTPPADLADSTVATNLAGRYTWEFWESAVSRLWSMPSTHTIAAFLTAGVLVRIYPRLWPAAWTMATMVGIQRLLPVEGQPQHFPSDVVVGATLGILAGRAACDLNLLERLVSALTPPQKRTLKPRTGKLPSLANAVRVQQGEEPRPEQLQ